MRGSKLVGIPGGIGTVRVQSSGPLGHLMRRIVGLPLRGDVHRAELEVVPTIAGEAWIRRFGDRRHHHRTVCSRLRAIDADTVAERLGAVTLTFDMSAGLGDAGPLMQLTSARIWAIRLGRRWLSVDVSLAPQGTVDETASRIRARVLGGRLGKLDYSVVMTPASPVSVGAAQHKGECS